MTHFILDTAGKPFESVAWAHRDVLSCAPIIDLAPGTNRDVFAGQCVNWWDAKSPIKACHVMRFGCAFMPGQWLGPQTPAQYREQVLGGFSRLGNEAVWLDEIYDTFKRIKLFPDLIYFSYEDQAQVFEWSDNSPAWAFIDALTGDKRLPRNLRYTTAYGLKKITSLAAWLKTRTPYVKSCWYSFFHPVQWGQLSACLAQSRLGGVSACSWNAPNYRWTDPATWESETSNRIAPGVHLPMYDWDGESLAKYRQVLEYTDGDVVAHVRPDQPFDAQLRLLDEYDVDTALVFCDPTQEEAWMRGIGPFIDKVRRMRED